MIKIAILIFAIVGTTLAGIIITAMLTVPGLVDGKPLMIIAGAVGGYVGGHLARAGRDITLVDQIGRAHV